MRLSNFKLIGRCKLSEHSASEDGIDATVDMTTGYLWWKETRSLHVMCAALGHQAVGRWVVRYRLQAPHIPQPQISKLYDAYMGTYMQVDRF